MRFWHSSPCGWCIAVAAVTPETALHPTSSTLARNYSGLFLRALRGSGRFWRRSCAVGLRPGGRIISKVGKRWPHCRHSRLRVVPWRLLRYRLARTCVSPPHFGQFIRIGADGCQCATKDSPVDVMPLQGVRIPYFYLFVRACTKGLVRRITHRNCG